MKAYIVLLALVVAGCGTDVEQRAASGGLFGGGIGGLCCGPFGALIGASAGAVGGWVTPIPADVAMKKGEQELNAVTPAFLKGNSESSESSRSATAQPQIARAPVMHISPDTVKNAQSNLQKAGLYRGPIDGIVGAKTRQAISDFQRQKGMTATGELDDATLNALDQTPSNQPSNQPSDQTPPS